MASDRQPAMQADQEPLEERLQKWGDEEARERAKRGALFWRRREELGYTGGPGKGRPAFERDTGIHRRTAADLENGYRDNFKVDTLNHIARAYQVTYDSASAVLRGEADELVPAAPLSAGPSAPSAAPGLPPAPASELLREDAVRPYAVPIWNRLYALAAEGVLDPDGARLGLAPDDAKVWDGSAGAMSLADRAWLVGDIRRRREARATGHDANSA